MNEAISIIKDEHRSMAAVLKGLLAHVADAKAGRKAADPHLLAAMFDYIEAFPERQHHPKEDEYLFRLLRMRAEESHAILDELQAQHAQGAAQLQNMRRKLNEYRESGNLAAFEQVLAAYAQFQWDHMRKEEEIVIPMAERHLTTEDWQTIAVAFRVNRDPTW